MSETAGPAKRGAAAAAASAQPAQPAQPSAARAKFTLTQKEGAEGVKLTEWDSLQYYSPYVLMAAILWTGHPWAAVWVAFAAVPVLDQLLPLDMSNVDEKERERTEDWLSFRMPLYLWAVAQALAGAHILGRVADPSMPALDLLGLLLSMSTVGAVGITVAHELLHKARRIDTWLAHALLCMANYGHFFTEHVAGHHKTVATPEDAASATAEQTVYEFYPQSLVHSYTSAWRHETRRSGPLNRMLPWAAAPVLLAALVARAYGGRAALFFVAQAWIAHFMLEVINYIEHYGLRRRRLPGGAGYEPVDPTHSWNAPQLATNALLFKLQRHSDHHANATRPYHVLRCFEESPEMPAGYATMLIMALCPPVWFRVMRPLVDHYEAARAAGKFSQPPAEVVAASRRGAAVFAYSIGAVITAALYLIS